MRLRETVAIERETAILRLLEQSLNEIQHELDACGADEVRVNPILKSKQRFVDRARTKIENWKSGSRSKCETDE